MINKLRACKKQALEELQQRIEYYQLRIRELEKGDAPELIKVALNYHCD